MTLKPIKSEEEYDQLMDWIDDQFDKKVEPSSISGETLQIALLWIKAFEDEYYPIKK
jgi:HTH-type transcriptional regulator / antitoxin HigA